MTIIYIRHGEDKMGHYEHDEKLTSKGKKQTRKVARRLIEDYGLPDIIYYSPFYRVRQTRKHMMKIIRRYMKDNNIDEDVELILEPRLGRFFTRRQKKYPDVRDSTLYKGAIIHEQWEDFHERIEEHFDEIKNTDKVIWNITHT